MAKAITKLLLAYITNLGSWILWTIALYLLLDISFSKTHRLEVDFSYLWRPLCAAASMWLARLVSGKVGEEIRKDFKIENQ